MYENYVNENNIWKTDNYNFPVAKSTPMEPDGERAKMIDSALKNEETERKEEDDKLNLRINKEIEDRKNADNVLQANIEKETADRIAADNALDAKINKEIQDRKNEINRIDGIISGGGVTQESFDNLLTTSRVFTTEKNNIKTNSDNIDILESSLNQAEDNINENLTKITTIENGLNDANQRITQNANNIKNERTERTNEIARIEELINNKTISQDTFNGLLETSENITVIKNDITELKKKSDYVEIKIPLAEEGDNSKNIILQFTASKTTMILNRIAEINLHDIATNIVEPKTYNLYPDTDVIQSLLNNRYLVYSGSIVERYLIMLKTGGFIVLQITFNELIGDNYKNVINATLTISSPTPSSDLVLFDKSIVF